MGFFSTSPGANDTSKAIFTVANNWCVISKSKIFLHRLHREDAAAAGNGLALRLVSRFETLLTLMSVVIGGGFLPFRYPLPLPSYFSHFSQRSGRAKKAMRDDPATLRIWRRCSRTRWTTERHCITRYLMSRLSRRTCLSLRKLLSIYSIRLVFTFSLRSVWLVSSISSITLTMQRVNGCVDYYQTWSQWPLR